MNSFYRDSVPVCSPIELNVSETARGVEEMQKSWDAMLGFKLPATEKLVVERASEWEQTTVSEFIRTAVLPAARETIVQHAIKAPLGDAA